MKAVRQARLELSGGSTPDQLKPGPQKFSHMVGCQYSNRPPPLHRSQRGLGGGLSSAPWMGTGTRGRHCTVSNHVSEVLHNLEHLSMVLDGKKKRTAISVGSSGRQKQSTKKSIQVLFKNKVHTSSANCVIKVLLVTPLM